MARHNAAPIPAHEAADHRPRRDRAAAGDLGDCAAIQARQGPHVLSCAGDLHRCENQIGDPRGRAQLPEEAEHLSASDRQMREGVPGAVEDARERSALEPVLGVVCVGCDDRLVKDPAARQARV